MNIRQKIKTQRMELRLSPTQKALLKQRAAEQKLTIAEFIISRLGLGE